MPEVATQLHLSIETGWELLTVEEDRQAGRFTADLLAKNQERLEAVLAAVAEGMPVRSIARAFGISVNTVLAAKRRFGERIDAEKQRLGRDCFDVARLAAERVREEIMEMPRASLPIVLGVFAEKGLLLTGAPTARIEHTDGPSVRSIADYIEALPVSVSPGEETLQKAGLDPLALPGSTVAEVATLTTSTVSSPSSEESATDGPETGRFAQECP